MKPTPLTLTSSQLRRAIEELEGTKLTQQTLSYYVATNLVQPSIAVPRGRGAAHLYTLGDLARLRLVLRLRREGLTLPRVRLIVAELARELPDVLRTGTRAHLIVVGGRGVIVERPGENAVKIPGAQLLLPLAACVEGNAATARDVRRAA